MTFFHILCFAVGFLLGGLGPYMLFMNRAASLTSKEAAAKIDVLNEKILKLRKWL